MIIQKRSSVVALLLAAAACSSAGDRAAWMQLSPDAGVKFALGTLSGTVADRRGCWGLIDAGGTFRPFIFYGTASAPASGGGGIPTLSYGGKVIAAGDRVTAVGQVQAIADLEPHLLTRTPDECGAEGVLIRNFSQIQRVEQ